MDIKDQLVFVRAKLDLTQQVLAQKLNVSFSTLNRWETGKTTPTKKAQFVFREFCKKNNIVFEEKQGNLPFSSQDLSTSK